MVSKVFSQDRNCNVLWSRSSSTPRRRSSRFSPRTWWGFNSASWSRLRSAPRQLSGVALVAPFAFFVTVMDLDMISMSPVPANTSPHVHASVYGCFWKNFVVISMLKVDPNPEAERCSHLEFLDNFYEPLVSGSHESTEASEEFLGFST